MPNQDIQSGIEAVKNFSQETVDAARASLDVAEKALEDGVKTSVAWIRKHPVESALIGLGIGCLIGTMLGKRKQ